MTAAHDSSGIFVELGIAVIGSEPFDVVRGVPVGCLGNAIERTLDLIEANQKRTGQRRNSGHLQSPRFQATLTGAPKTPHRTDNARPIRLIPIWVSVVKLSRTAHRSPVKPGFAGAAVW